MVAIAKPRKMETGRADATTTAKMKTEVTGFSMAYDFMAARRFCTNGGTLKRRG